MSGGEFLSRMAAASRQRARAARAAVPEAELMARARELPDPAPLILSGFDVIAELKLRSPAAGGLAPGEFDFQRQIAAYTTGGAAAISVLTEPEQFAGSLGHLEAAVAAAAERQTPIMRKDFLTEPYQVVEARAAGASGVLVIVTMLDDDAVQALVDRAQDLGLFVLLEGFDKEDLTRIESFADGHDDGSILAGVNCRNLKDLQVDFGRFELLADALPKGLPTVAESGIGSADDAAIVAALGYRLCLVGSALMQSDAPATLLSAIVAAGRGALRE